MKLFGTRAKRPVTMEWGSSFADAELSKGRRHRRALQRAGYDSRTMAAQPPEYGSGSQRPIGSRRIDGVPAGAYGSAPDRLPPRRGPGIGRRILNFLLLVAAIALIGGIVYGVWNLAGGGSDVEAGTTVTVKIPSGADSSRIADILAEAGVVGNETVFRARLRMNGDGGDFRSGTYSMKTGSSYDTVVRVLEKGPAAAPTFKITLPEGQRLEETAATIDRLRAESLQGGGKPQPAFTGAEWLKAARAVKLPASYGAPAKLPAGTTGSIVEGFLFPATYDLKLTATAQELVEKQRAAFDEQFATIDLARAKAAQLSPYEVVTIASLVEREARLPKERPLVAAVIWNRIKIGEPLGIDASNQYSVYEQGSKEFWTTELLQSDLDKESPYNLRKVQGLPPTAIAAPGLASLQAAANPAKVDYRYYVANPDGSGEHFFTESYDEFLAHPFQNG